MTDDPYPPLRDIRVLDASRVLAGPFCGQILGDLGAEVIKVERPGAGDETRAWGPPFAGPLSAYFLSCNRNKRGIALDLSQKDGLDLFYRLVERSDVLLENFRAASTDKLGLSPEKLHARNPRLIVCSISGFGRTGPMSDLPGYDFAIQGLSGLMSITGPPEGPPCKVGVAVADVLTGFYASNTILAALHARSRTGHGYAIDLALADCALASQVNVAQAFLTSSKLPQRQGNAHLQIVPYQLFATADGWLVLNVGNDGQWKAFCAAAGANELGSDSRFATNRQRVELRTEVVPKVETLMKQFPTAEWEKRLTDANVPHAVVRTYDDVFRAPQTRTRGMKVTVRDPAGNAVDLVGNPVVMHGAPVAEPTMPPRLGAQTETVLSELLGLDAETVKSLRERGIV